MKAKAVVSSEMDAKEKLIVYVYEYLTRTGAKQAAATFLEEIRYEKSIQFSTPEGPGFLFNWFVLFWDLYASTKAHEPKHGNNQVEPTVEGQTFMNYHMRTVMSPQQQHPSPPQAPPYTNQGPRGSYAGPPQQNHSNVPMRHHGPPMPQMNVGAPRMPMGQPHLPPPHMVGGPPPMNHSHGPSIIGMPNGPHHGPPPSMMGNAPSPRYANHGGPITPGPGGPEPGPSPGLVNRMTPNHGGSPHPHLGVVGPPPGGPPPGPMHPGMPSHSPMSHPVGPPPPMQQRGGPGPSSWQGNYGSPAEQCFMPGPPGQPNQPNDFGGMMMNDGPSMMEMKPPQPGTNNVNNNNGNNAQPANSQDDYVMAGAYGQPTDQGGDEIRKLKESFESDDGDQTGFNMDQYVESQATSLIPSE